MNRVLRVTSRILALCALICMLPTAARCGAISIYISDLAEPTGMPDVTCVSADFPSCGSDIVSKDQAVGYLDFMYYPPHPPPDTYEYTLLLNPDPYLSAIFVIWATGGHDTDTISFYSAGYSGSSLDDVLATLQNGGAILSSYGSVDENGDNPVAVYQTYLQDSDITITYYVASNAVSQDAVPEPACLLLVGPVLGALILRRRCRRA